MPESQVSRRSALLGAAGLAGVAATGGTWWALQAEGTPTDGRVLASSEAVIRAERARRARGSGRTVRAALTAEPAEVDLGGRVVQTWTYNQRLPGPVVRCTAGDELAVELTNRLPEPTTAHWHGIRVRNDMDGVPNLTQSPIPAGDRMRYSFTVPDAGTYWLHPHVGLQRERGLYCPLIVDDPRERGDYDVEFVVVLDDWIDGAGATPDQVLDTLKKHGMDGKYRTAVRAGKIDDDSAQWEYHVPAELAKAPRGIQSVSPASRMASSVEFPFYLLNGRLPTAPETFRAKPGQRARIRLINAAGATVFRVALGGHKLTVTDTDGFPIEPVTVDTLQVASGERYDVLVTLEDGAFPLVAVAEGKKAQALGVVRTGSGAAPPTTAAPAELAGRLLGLPDLRATADVHIEQRSPEVSHTAYLTGDMRTFGWRINAETYQHRRPFAGVTPLTVRERQRVRLEMVNQTPMYHPMHLHGHTFAVHGVSDTAGRRATEMPRGTRKDTVLVGPGERVVADLIADNPGQWLMHCHNAYHMATGMAAVVSYVSGD